MKNNRFCSILVLIIFFTACTTDQEVIPDEDYELTTEIKTDQRGPEYFEAEVLIVWNSSVSENRKEEIRNKYKKNKVLIRFLICDDIKYETWDINCPNGACSRDSDTPVDTDDEVERVFVELTCEDL
tara:strand:- start:54195 stop:54575 length:381 start_codon:yes stop_codon:yes gene_type:complete